MMLMFHKNLPVIPARLVKYFEAPEFRNGGTGAPRRLGFAAAVLAAFTLCLGMLLAGAGVMVAAMPPVRWQASRGRRAQPDGTGRRPRPPAGRKPGGQSRPAPRNPAAAAVPPRRRRPGPSGFLIKIQ